MTAPAFAFEFLAIMLAFHQGHRLLRAEDAEAMSRAAFEALLKRSRV